MIQKFFVMFQAKITFFDPDIFKDKVSVFKRKYNE